MDNESFNYKKSFGKSVKHLRSIRRISQEHLSEKTGLHRTYISEIERGVRNVSLINIIKISQGLGVKSSFLLSTMEKEFINATK